ncbi:DUF1573 domain-containing protein [uncultured Alistipes sp.]|jgi:hypothetical protein|uniref:DUF1573 domain-containing protein n=1 Tax=uncultured Alistipes sp. TaxID=538949 RepID=UPI0025CD6BF6|nr:DUF1573 domain-containing protein [uncultured Alistipes sp.]
MLRVVFLCWLGVALNACVSRPTPVGYAGRVVSLTDSLLACGWSDTVRLGKLHSGEVAVSRLQIANHAPQAVVISSFERSCGCVAFSFEESPLLPGQTRELTLTFDSRGLWGWQFKSLDIRFAGAARPWRIFVDVDVK